MEAEKSHKEQESCLEIHEGLSYGGGIRFTLYTIPRFETGPMGTDYRESDFQIVWEGLSDSAFGDEPLPDRAVSFPIISGSFGSQDTCLFNISVVEEFEAYLGHNCSFQTRESLILWHQLLNN